jgi:hypothetical protein
VAGDLKDKYKINIIGYYRAEGIGWVFIWSLVS